MQGSTSIIKLKDYFVSWSATHNRNVYYSYDGISTFKSSYVNVSNQIGALGGSTSTNALVVVDSGNSEDCRIDEGDTNIVTSYISSQSVYNFRCIFYDSINKRFLALGTQASYYLQYPNLL